MEKRETVFNALHLYFNNRLYDVSGGNDGLFTLARVLVKTKIKRKKKCARLCYHNVTHNISLVKKESHPRLKVLK